MRKGALLAIAGALAFGSLGVLTKLAYADGWNVPSLLTARFVLATLTVLPFALAARGGWDGFRGALLLGGVGYVATTALYFPSFRLLPAAVATFLLYLAPALVAAASYFVFRERLGRAGLVALALALLGLALLCAGAITGALDPLGVLLAALSAVTYAASILYARRLGDSMHPTRMALGVCLGAAASWAAFALVTRQLWMPWSAAAVGHAIGIGTIATGLALVLFFAALPRLGASRTAVVSTLEPVSTLILAGIVLREWPGAAGLVGGALIVAAAALVALTPRKQ